MPGKKRKIRQRVKAGLERQTANLSPEERKRRYEKTRVSMATKTVLDTLGVEDKRTRRNVHGIMQSMGNRIQMIADFESPKTYTEVLKKGSKRGQDLYIKQCLNDLKGQLGAAQAINFYFKFLFSLVSLNFQMRPKKEKT